MNLLKKQLVDKYELCNESRGLLEELNNRIMTNFDSINYKHVRDVFPKPKNLNTEERRKILEKTFALGNKIYRENNEQILLKTMYKQCYTPRYIKIDPSITKTIHEMEKFAKSIDSLCFKLNLNI